MIHLRENGGRIFIAIVALLPCGCGCPSLGCEEFFQETFVAPVPIGSLGGAVVSVEFDGRVASCALPDTVTSSLDCRGAADGAAMSPSLWVHVIDRDVVVELSGAAPACVNVAIATHSGQATFAAAAEYQLRHAGGFECDPEQCLTVVSTHVVSSCPAK